MIHAIETRPGGRRRIARSAGAGVQLVAKDGPYAQLRMPSGEIRNVDVRCRATIEPSVTQSNQTLTMEKLDVCAGKAVVQQFVCCYEPS